MSATFGNFCERVSRAIRRGTLYDDDIPEYAADAVRELEDMQDWKYMWNEGTGTLTVGDNTITLTRCKNVRFLNLTADSGAEFPLFKVKREDVSEIASDRPRGFWMKTRDIIGLDAEPDQAYTYSIGYFQYTARPLTDTCAWLTLAEDVFMARTILKMQPLLRDDKLLQRWSAVENNRLPTLLQAELDSEVDGADNVMVPFYEEMIEYGLEWEF